MNFEHFRKLDSDLAQRFLEVEQQRESVSKWHDGLRKQLCARLAQLGHEGLGEPVISNDVETFYASVDEQAAGIDDHILNPLVISLKQYDADMKSIREQSDTIQAEIHEKYGLGVAVPVGDDTDNFEDQFEFIVE